MKILSFVALLTVTSAQQDFVSVEPFLPQVESFDWSTAGVGAAAGVAYFSGKATNGFWRDNQCSHKLTKSCLLICGGGALLNIVSLATMVGLAGHVYEEYKQVKTHKSVLESHYEAVEAISVLLQDNGCQLLATEGYLGRRYFDTSDNATLTWIKDGEVVKREFEPGRVLTQLLGA